VQGAAVAAVAGVLALGAAYVFGTALLCGLVEGAAWCHWWPHLSLSRIQELVRSAGGWGVAASIGLMVLHSFVPFPAEFITITNGMVYGIGWGILITWVGAMLGAFLAFGLARTLGRSYVHRKLQDRNLLKVEDWVAHYGRGALLVSRFIPVISFNLINYTAGLLQVSWRTFAWTTGIGILPLTVLMVVMGDRISTLTWQGWFLLLGCGLALWVLTHYLARRHARRFSGRGGDKS
jgi:uncharacterized membrane protein YdjX (TVP38/TMEM64 family)